MSPMSAPVPEKNSITTRCCMLAYYVFLTYVTQSPHSACSIQKGSMAQQDLPASTSKQTLRTPVPLSPEEQRLDWLLQINEELFSQELAKVVSEFSCFTFSCKFHFSTLRSNHSTSIFFSFHLLGLFSTQPDSLGSSGCHSTLFP